MDARLAHAAILMLLAAAPAWGQATPNGMTPSTPWYEGFDSPQTSWVFVGGDARYQLNEHKRAIGDALTGDGSEYVRVTVMADGGKELFIAHDVGRPKVLESLRPSLDIRSNKPGITMSLEVVLPRSIDPETGRPLTTLISSSTAVYNSINRRQRLAIDNIPRELRKKTWVLRREHGPWVDASDAYVNRLLLNIHGGAGVTELWIDNLDVAGYYPAPNVNRTIADGGTSTDPRRATPSAPIGSAHANPPVASVAEMSAAAFERLREPVGGSLSKLRRIRFSGTTLLIDGEPFLPRMVEYRGEPLAMLKRIGFNTVWLAGAPNEQLLTEAARERMWIVCPPPSPHAPENWNGGQPVPITENYDRVLAWNVGRGLESSQLQDVSRWVDQIRAADRERARPILCQAYSGVRSYSQLTDLVLVGRRPLLTTLKLPEYETWLLAQTGQAIAGTPTWTSVQTQPAPSLRAQWQAMSGDRSLGNGAVSLDQIRAVVRIALASGGRGLLFESDTPLDSADDATKRRAKILELVNLELRLMEPWIAGGAVLGEAQSSVPGIRWAVLQTDHSRLLAPFSTAPDAQFVIGKAAGRDSAFLIPGVPEDYESFLLSPGALRPLRSTRPAGGTRVSIDEFNPASLVAMSQDPRTIQLITERARAVGPRAVELRLQILDADIAITRDILSRLPAQASVDPSIAREYLALAEEHQALARSLLESKDYFSAMLRAERAAEPVRILQQEAWTQLTSFVPSPTSAPACASFATLPAHEYLTRRLRYASYSPSRIRGGDHEDLGAWLSSGWNRLDHPVKGVEGDADLANAAARSGRMGLRLAAQPDEAEPAAWVRSAPVVIRSPEVSVREGALICIHGWVNAPTPIEGSVDGLMVFDSLGGEALAERFRSTDGWQEFTLYRFAPRDDRLTVSIALTGLGEAWLDDISIQEVLPGGEMTSGSTYNGYPRSTAQPNTRNRY